MIVQYTQEANPKGVANEIVSLATPQIDNSNAELDLHSVQVGPRAVGDHIDAIFNGQVKTVAGGATLTLRGKFGGTTGATQALTFDTNGVAFFIEIILRVTELAANTQGVGLAVKIYNSATGALVSDTFIGGTTAKTTADEFAQLVSGQFAVADADNEVTIQTCKTFKYPAGVDGKN